MKTNITLSMDGEVHNQIKKYLSEKGISFSSWVEQQCRKYIQNYEKEGK